MKREFLKTLELSDEAIDQIMAEHGKSVEKYKAEAGKVEGLNQTIADLQGQLNAANTQIEEFKGMDIDGIRKAADNWKEKAEQAERDAQAKISELEHDNLLREKLSGVKFTSDYAKKGVFDEIKAKGLKTENGILLGFDDALQGLRESQPDAFASETPPPSFAKATQSKITGITREDFSKMSYLDKVKLKTEQPEQYNELIGGNE